MDIEDNEKAKALWDRYLRGNCTLEEQAFMEAWYNRLYRENQSFPVSDQLDTIGKEIFARFSVQQPIRRMRVWIATSAAVLAVGLSVGIFVYVNQKSNRLGEIAASEILPGGNKATLTLADGRVISLDESQTGIIVGSGDITYADGSGLDILLAGKQSEAGTNNPSPRNTDDSATQLGSGQDDGQLMLSLSTPKGGTYHITLPDGSKVWLNAQTTFTYPAVFSKDERLVELDGEAYFSVNGNSKQPFTVKSKGQYITVLGTEFNLSAYKENAETKTTLVKGKVQVGLSGVPNVKEMLLKPGEQSTVKDTHIGVKQVELDPYTAWQKGYFNFSDSLETVMAKLARWYDLEVEFKDNALKKKFVFGSIQRNLPLSDVLDLLREVTDSKFVVLSGHGERRVEIMK